MRKGPAERLGSQTRDDLLGARPRLGARLGIAGEDRLSAWRLRNARGVVWPQNVQILHMGKVRQPVHAGSGITVGHRPLVGRGQVLERTAAKLEEGGLRVVASKRIRMSREQAEGFYAVHKGRPFFADLVAFMISGPVVVQVLEGENAVKRNRDIMGATNPENADAGTIRKEFAESIEANSVHGSDSEENAAIEIAYFFKPEEIVG